MVFKDEGELLARLKFWKEILRLQDWEIEASIARARDFGAEGGVGECGCVPEKKFACIRLLDPADWDPTWSGEQDHEYTLVHELLHVHLWLWPKQKSGLARLEEEQAIDAIAQGILRLCRS